MTYAERRPKLENTAGTVENIALAALAPLETCLMTYRVAMMALEEGIPGDFVECGVYAGAQSAIMAKAIQDFNLGCPLKPDTRKVHLFDSFEGCPAPGESDIEFKRAGHKEGQAACSIKGVADNMEQWGIQHSRLVYHVGWFVDTLRQAVGNGLGRIAVLRLDADLYSSTRECMAWLYPRLTAKGFLIVDDYGLAGCRRAVDEYFTRPGGPGWETIYLRKT